MALNRFYESYDEWVSGGTVVVPVFRGVHKIAKHDCWLRHVCPRGATQLALDGFS